MATAALLIWLLAAARAVEDAGTTTMSLRGALEHGVALHTAGEHERAMAVYEQVIAQSPTIASILFVDLT